jgi:hypothetical protein
MYCLYSTCTLKSIVLVENLNKVNAPFAAMFWYCLGRTRTSYARERVVERTRQEIAINKKARNNNTRQHKRARKLATASHFLKPQKEKHAKTIQHLPTQVRSKGKSRQKQMKSVCRWRQKYSSYTCEGKG